MNRRDFLTTTGLLTASSYMNACANNSDTLEETQKKPIGAATLYYEFKIAGIEIQSVMTNIQTALATFETKQGFLSLSLKMMMGSSTMVNNFDSATLKGVLKSAFIDSAKKGKRPFTYSLLIRFNTYDNLIASEAKDWFNHIIKPQLFMYDGSKTPPKKTPLALDYYQGIYKTVAAGDSNGVYTEQEDILTFLKNQKDIANPKYQTIPENGTNSGASITVQNHVTISDFNTKAINEKATVLLTVAQQTYQPSSNLNDGDEGSLDNNNYQKAISTEILQNAYSSADTRNYLFHGVWNSIADHENSHIDSRFIKASGPVGAFVIAGPIEPFYQTMILHNKN